ncbi:hypothetical protein [Streptacidiphilus carbonis]|uniref:hypothetical protein n=1 Tax=Streptacidiphilus carbonis TaxID=105422 RepID=UPI001269F822|nr:hypothetical protein [Streptacidiphilus carbonis]
MGLGWVCPSDECGQGGPERPSDRWPRRCPECGTEVVTFSLAEPWQHTAKRVEIDARLNGSPTYGDPYRAHAEDLLWTADEAFRAGRADQVPDIAAAMGSLLDAHRAAGGSYGFDQLFHLVRLLAAQGEWAVATDALRRWRHSVRHDNLEDNEQRTEARMLAASMIHCLEAVPTPPPADQQVVWEMLREFIPVISSVTTADIDRSWNRLQFTMAGRKDPEEALGRELDRLAAADAAQPPQGLPSETPLRMEILGRYTAKGPDSSLDASRISEVCLQPYLTVSPEELAPVVLPVGGWTVYGASRCLRDCGTQDENGLAYGAIWDAGLQFYRTTGVGTQHLSFHDHQRWIARHGSGSW